MYDNFKLLNYSNSLVSPELYARHLSRLFTGNVVDGLLVVPKTGLTVTLPSGNGFIPYGSGATASAREFSLVADFDITLDTADASNPRIDLIVVYVDMAVSLPGGTPSAANLDGLGVVKATFVKGTPNASPVDPTVGAIQTKIGASNPYIIVAAVRVDALVGTIAGNKITDRRVFAQLGTANINKTGIWWEELGRSTLASPATSMTVNLTSSKKHLMIYFAASASGGTITNYIRFNGDSGNNYAVRISTNTGASTVVANEPGISTAPSIADYYRVGEFKVTDYPSMEKMVEGYSTGSLTTATNAPVNRQMSGKWANAARITSITVITLSNNMAAGSELIVLGHD